MRRRRNSMSRKGKVIRLGGRKYRCYVKSVRVKVPGKRTVRRVKGFCRRVR